ncbi:MAG: DUF4105 domain-containing protein [Bacteroidota bacterium]
MKRILHLFLLFLLSFKMIGQGLPQLSKNAHVSVLTCGAGNQLYSAFGHTAFRVQDPVIGFDGVYNYGSFDFDKPNFYTNFAKGKLIYSLSRTTFERFLYEYEYEKRWVKEQVLDLTPEEVNVLFRFFENNYRPENRDYLYDPLFNNCSNVTGIILQGELKDTIKYNGSHLEKWRTFRELVRERISLNTWGSFGIELSFGGITDRVANTEEHMFQPFYAMRQFQNTTKNGKPLVKRERTILNYPDWEYQSIFTLSPLFWFLLLLCFVLVITYLDFKHGTRHRWLDFSLFFISGITGIGILLLWLATDHVVTHYNFNFLWLLPSNLVVAFYLMGRQATIKWLKKYLWIAFGCIGLILIFWIFGVQVLSPLNVPLMLVLSARYLLLLKRA